MSSHTATAQTRHGGHVVIVGAGQAGGTAAQALRAAGHAGGITLVGAELHLPYERPPLSKDVLDGKCDAASTHLQPHGWYDAQRIDLQLGRRAVAIERVAQRVELDDGSSIGYDALLLATGARPRRATMPGADGPKVRYLRDIADALALRDALAPGVRLAIIGGGFIGLEVAAAARRRGAEVTLFELAPHLLSRVTAPALAAFFESLHRDNGVVVHTGVSIGSIEDRGSHVTLCSAAGLRLDADLVLIGIGSVPNAALAEAAGLAVRDGVVVDAHCRTSDPHNWAAGDVTNHHNPLLGRHLRLESWHNAKQQSTAAARVIAGGNLPYAELPWFWSDQYDINFQTAGAPQPGDEVVLRGHVEDRSFSVFHLRDSVPTAVATINNGRDIRPATKLITDGRRVDIDALANPAVKLQSLITREASS